MVPAMPDAGLTAEDFGAVPTPEPPAARRRLRVPVPQTIDLLFVDRQGRSRNQEVPVYDGQGQPKRRLARPGTMLNMVA